MFRLALRTLHALLLLAAVSLFSFLLLSLAPGNFFDELKLNPQISPDTVAALKAQYGVDRPLPVRYWRWTQAAVRGDFGYSLSYHCSVGTLLWPRARNTLLLTACATVFAWMIALPWGVLEALHRGRWIDRLGATLTTLLLATPELLLGLLLLLIAARTGWLPTGGMSSLDAQTAGTFGKFADTAKHLILPVIALALAAAPLLVRHVRSAMIAVLDSPFLEAARSFGIPQWRLIVRHALPAAANSLVSLLGLSIGGLLSMSFLVEVILNWPGLGPLVLDAMLSRDTHVVMAAVMLSSVFLVAGNTIADLLLYYSDPRIRAV
jgi:peptide/nickel transport system permease protein